MLTDTSQSRASSLPQVGEPTIAGLWLLRSPRVEALLQLLTVISPEADVDLHLVGDVFRSGRHVFQNIFGQQRYGLGISRAVGNVFRIRLLRLWHDRERDEFLRSFGTGFIQTFWDRPGVEVVDTAVPYDFQVAFFLHGSDPAVVGRAHHDVTRGQILRRLSARFPPLNAWLELIELLEGTVLTIFAGQHFVDIFGGDAVGHQSELQGVLGAFTQATLAREFLGVPEIRPTGRCAFQLVGVVGEHGRPDEEANAARLNSTFDVVFGFAEQGWI